MLDLPDHGYVAHSLKLLDPGGVAVGTLGSASDIVDRPGVRYACTYTLPMLRSSDEARQFQAVLEQAARDEVSYPWPMDFRSLPAGNPTVNGASPAGAVIPIKGLRPHYQFKQGQVVAVISGGHGYVHRATTTTLADGGGAVLLPVFPYTRAAFANDDVVEVERPRIRGLLSFDSVDQGSFGMRNFQFTIAERF